MRWGAGGAAVEVARIVFDARAHAHLGEHFQIVGGAHVEALRFQLLALLTQFCQAFVEFLANGFERAFHAFGAGHVMGGREDVDFVFLVDLVAGQRVQRGDAVDLVAEEFDAHGQFLVDGDDFDRIAAHAEGAAREGGFAGAGGAHEHHVVLAVFDAFGQFGDGLRLVAGWLIRRFDDERLVRALDIESHRASS